MAIHTYTELTGVELTALDPGRTILLSSLSPLEVHGPHLPIGTDITIAESLRDRIAGRLEARHPELELLVLPTIPLGSDPIPVSGSIPVRPGVIESILIDWGTALSRLGFRYWILTDNHGGPHHQIAIETASRKLRRRGIVVIAPFPYTFRQMIAGSGELRDGTGLGPGEDGGLEDMHAGTNETSLMLAASPSQVRDGAKSVGPARKSESKFLSRALSRVAGGLKRAGATDASLDLVFLAHGLAWVGDPDMEPYQGDPSKASPEAGERMLAYRAAAACRILEEAMEGGRPALKPMGWSIRALRRIV